MGRSQTHDFCSSDLSWAFLGGFPEQLHALARVYLVLPVSGFTSTDQPQETAVCPHSRKPLQNKAFCQSSPRGRYTI
eukprot:1611125-Amphidinium_carterae.1